VTEEDKAKIVGSIKDIDDMESNLFHSLSKTQPKKSLGKTKKAKPLSEIQQQKQLRVTKKVSFEDEEFDEQEQELMREINKGLATTVPVRVNSSPPPSSKPQQDATSKKITKSSMCACMCVYCKVGGANYMAAAGLKTHSDDDIDDDDDIFADLLSGSEEEDEKDKDKLIKPKLKLTTNTSKTQSSNSNNIDDGKITLMLYQSHI